MRNRNQVVLPLNLEICIPKDDPVFKMVEICEQLDYTELYRAYLRSWRKINPETLFELLVFGYMNRKYSSRQIEEACRTDIRYMWILQGEPVPDHSTIAIFQNEKLSGVIEDLFYQLVEKVHEAGEVGFRNIFVDGTKIEANANRYTFVCDCVCNNIGTITAILLLLYKLLCSTEQYCFCNQSLVVLCIRHVITTFSQSHGEFFEVLLCSFTHAVWYGKGIRIKRNHASRSALDRRIDR